MRQSSFERELCDYHGLEKGRALAWGVAEVFGGETRTIPPLEKLKAMDRNRRIVELHMQGYKSSVIFVRINSGRMKPISIRTIQRVIKEHKDGFASP